MAHTTRKVNLGNTAFAQVIFTSYTAGGESFTIAEFGLTGALVDVWFVPTTDSQNRQSNSMFAQYAGGGIIKLVYPSGAEFPTMASLNFSVFCIVQAT